ncbi:hypothetical protein MJT46_015425 [Ovis ammon polii x Ovis aries]|nr:hypothetical protein MJT46_015425 [Ovis ammon polii x Ovis aries]
MAPGQRLRLFHDRPPHAQQGRRKTSANGNRLTYAFRTAARRRHTTNTISGFRGNPVRGADSGLISELWGQLSEEHDSTVLSSTDAHALVSAPSCPNHSNSKDPNVFLCSWSRRTKSEHPLVVRRSDGTSDVSQGQSFRGSALRSEAEQERETHEPDLSPGPACDADGSSPPAIEEQSVQHGGAGTPLGLGIEKLRQNRGQFEDALCQAWEQGCADDCALF